MRIVRERMLCIISPEWPDGLTPLSPEVLDGVRTLCTELGVVHFASLALLPASPGAGTGARPSLLFELAVDEGIRPDDLLARFAYHPSGALWPIYSVLQSDAQPGSVGARNEMLLETLRAGLNVSDGAFVGPRDRTVAQIRQERALYDATRNQHAKVPALLKQDRASLALALARWAFQQARFEGIASRAPRSYWRGAGAPLGAKLRLLVGFVGMTAAALWFGIFVLGQLRQAVDWPGGLPLAWQHGLQPALGLGVNVLCYLLGAGFRTLVALAAAGLLFWSLFSVLPAIVPAWGRWLSHIGRELNRPTDAWSSRAAHAYGWLLVGLLIVVGLGYVLFDVGLLAEWLTPIVAAPPRGLAAALQVFGGVFVAMLLILTLGLRTDADTPPNRAAGWLGAKRYALKRWFHRPIDTTVPRAQQVHESIEKCEAALVAGTAHMISLTELRWPYAWSAWWTRRSLRFVTLVGHLRFTEGRLGVTPGIQFSHWHIVGGRRLLFCANFDGTFGGYLDDFIKGPSIGTTLFWRWTRLLPRDAAVDGEHPAVENPCGFPPTRLFVFRGVKCEQQFKTYARESMLPYLFRFDACQLSLEQKLHATELRDALFGERTDVSDDRMMRVLET